MFNYKKKQKNRLIRSFSGIDAQFEFDGSNTFKEKMGKFTVLHFIQLLFILTCIS